MNLYFKKLSYIANNNFKKARKTKKNMLFHVLFMHY